MPRPVHAAMKITALRVVSLYGEPDESFSAHARPFAERAVYTDIYPQYPKRRAYPDIAPKRRDNGRLAIRHRYLRVESDDGCYGLAGPVRGDAVVFYLLRVLRLLLPGLDPLDAETVWDLMYRTAPHGRKGDYMLAASLADIALWDLKARREGKPLHQLLGPVRQGRVPVYANALGYSAEAAELAPAIAALAAEGYQAVKLGGIAGPAHGEAGMERTREQLRLAREAAGPDRGLILDVWGGWNPDYARKMLPLLGSANLRWLEEPFSQDQVEDYAALRKESPVPVACGEHEYTRWGFGQLLREGAGDIYMPDPAWCGGITETLKIMEAMERNAAAVTFHNSITALGAHLSAVYPESLVPVAEYIPLVSEPAQYFLKYPCRPVNGFFSPPREPGAGFDLDDGKICEQHDMTLADLERPFA